VSLGGIDAILLSNAVWRAGAINPKEEAVSSVFHYTDVNGLLGILSSETIFATDYRYLNDITEAGLVRELLLPLFEAEIAEITPKLVEKGWLSKDFYTEHGVSGHRLQAEKLYLSLIRGVDRVSPFFVSSFCRHDEGSHSYHHGLLSQWRGYAQTGGVAIEFDEQRLDSLMKEENARYTYAGFKSDDVRYDQLETTFNSNAFKGVAGEMIWQIFDEAKINVCEVTGRKNLDQAVIDFAITAPFLKHSGFKEEREYRVVAVCIRRGRIPNGETRETKEIKFRPRNGLIVPYIELFDKSQQDFPVISVIVGPHPYQEKQAEAVRMFLESQYLNNVNVRLSALPYRA
jgi:Protein of unknown function (DUF2971)